MPNLIGTAPNQVPTNGMLGTAAFMGAAQLPVSVPQQGALDTKAPTASPTFTGTVSGITKAMVGLGNVDNTSDANKPVSTAQQTALNLKANLASPALTGTPTAPTAAVGTNTTQLATTAFVNAEIANDTASKADKASTVLTPATSATPPANGNLVFERTSNTSLTLRLKGTDGVVRSVALTLA